MKEQDLEVLRNRIIIYNQNKKLDLLNKMDKQTILENEALEKLLKAYEKLMKSKKQKKEVTK